MSSPNPIQRGVAFAFPVALTSQANPLVFQVAPTLAAGDVKVRKKVAGSWGAYANIATLPSPTAGEVTFDVSLSASEMDGDWVEVLFRDAAGTEWCDLLLPIPTGLDLSGTTVEDATDVQTTLAAIIAEIAAIKAKTDNLPTDPADNSEIIEAIEDHITGPGTSINILRILVGGTPVANANVWITSDSSGNNVVWGTFPTNNAGTVSVRLTPGTTYYLWAEKDGMNPIEGAQFTAT
jgi:hypothetical protein